jgi:Zn-dependent protease with chaperone function
VNDPPAEVPPAPGRHRRLPAGGATLIAASLLLDFPSDLLRLVVVSVVLGAFVGLGPLTDALAILAAVGPALRSITALLAPVSAGPLYRAGLGARRPSAREAEALDTAARLCAGVAVPRDVRVLDSPDENAWVLGSTLFVCRGLFESPHLAAVVAHEAGHLAAGDGQVALSAWWLPVRLLARPARRLIAGRAGRAREDPSRRTLPQPHAVLNSGPAPRTSGRSLVGWVLHIPAVAVGAALLVLAGGLVPMLLRPAWAPYRRRREFAADAFAAAAGQGPGLIEALGDWQMLDVATPWWQGRGHPYIEERIDRLQRMN